MAEQLDQIITLLKLDVLDKVESLKIVKEKTGVNPSVLGLALGIFLLICVLVSSSAVPLVVGVGCYLVPGYFTFVAMESHDREDDIRFLTYWIVFSTLEVLSPIVTLILSPGFYAIARIALTGASIHPSINLSGKIYHQIMEPYLLKYQSKIDRGIKSTE